MTQLHVDTFILKFIDFMLKGKSLLEYTSLLSPNQDEKNDKIILKYFQYILKRLKRKKIYCIVWDKYKKSKNPKTTYIL